MTPEQTAVHDEGRGHPRAAGDGPTPAALACSGHADLAEAVTWLREIAEVSLRAATLCTDLDAARTHCRRAKAANAGAQALAEVASLRAIETAATVLLRVSGPSASWGEHAAAERVLRGLLAARGHQVGERAE